MIEDGKISAHVKLSELVRSDTAKRCNIDNSPGAEEITNLKLVCENVYEKVRNHFDKPIFISSGYRCKELNEKVGGQLHSQHMEGKALDLDCDIWGGLTNKELFDYIKSSDILFDQLLWEGGINGWVHVSFNLGKNRKYVGVIPNP